MSKAMKLSKYTLLKKFKSDEIISFTFPFIENLKREKRQLQNHFFAHEGCLFLPEIREKRPAYDNFWLFLQPPIIALCKKSSLYLKSVDLPKNHRYDCFQTVEVIEIYL
jgi:hypothetical protein